jgi:hypothetical protein
VNFGCRFVGAAFSRDSRLQGAPTKRIFAMIGFLYSRDG